MISEKTKKAVYGLYPNRKGWKDRVDKMPDKQILAIFHSRILNKSVLSDNKVITTMAANLRNQSKSESVWPEKQTTYHCHMCNATYVRDNNSLAYCEMCNSKLMEEDNNG